MLKILHFSDLHFGPPYLPHIGKAFLEIAPEIEADVLVCSGDFTQRAKEEQFQDAQGFLQKLPKLPLIVVPGNHDVPLYRVIERFNTPLDLYKKYISKDLDDVVEVPGATFVALNSTSPRRAISNGRIHRDQLLFTKSAFDEAPEENIRILVAHHHFCPAPDFEKDQVMPQAKRAINMFSQLGVELILGGHLHRAYIGNSLDVYPGKFRNRGIIIVQCGTTTSRRGRGREREKNSFNVIQIDDQTVHVAHYMYFNERETFAPISRHIFPRPGHAFLEGEVPMLEKHLVEEL
ncbi:Metallophosphoesterase [Planctomycetales bacterium 10988]|nr:Metallophosphoesterase [Planctomycetales bacterium 10988]